MGARAMAEACAGAERKVWQGSGLGLALRLRLELALVPRLGRVLNLRLRMGEGLAQCLGLEL